MSPSSLLSPASLLSHTGLLQTFTCLKNYFLVILILNCFSDNDWIKGPAFNPQLGLQIHALQKGIICKYKYKYKYMRFKKVSDITYRITHPSLESVHPSICVFCESIWISLTMSYLFVYESIVCVFVFLHWDVSVYLYSMFHNCICVFVFCTSWMYLCIYILYFIDVSVYLYSGNKSRPCLQFSTWIESWCHHLYRLHI